MSDVFGLYPRPPQPQAQNAMETIGQAVNVARGITATQAQQLQIHTARLQNLNQAIGSLMGSNANKQQIMQTLYRMMAEGTIEPKQVANAQGELAQFDDSTDVGRRQMRGWLMQHQLQAMDATALANRIYGEFGAANMGGQLVGYKGWGGLPGSDPMQLAPQPNAPPDLRYTLTPAEKATTVPTVVTKGAGAGAQYGAPKTDLFDNYGNYIGPGAGPGAGPPAGGAGGGGGGGPTPPPAAAAGGGGGGFGTGWGTSAATPAPAPPPGQVGGPPQTSIRGVPTQLSPVDAASVALYNKENLDAAGWNARTDALRQAIPIMRELKDGDIGKGTPEFYVLSQLAETAGIAGWQTMSHTALYGELQKYFARNIASAPGADVDSDFRMGKTIEGNPNVGNMNLLAAETLSLHDMGLHNLQWAYPKAALARGFAGPNYTNWKSDIAPMMDPWAAAFPEMSPQQRQRVLAAIQNDPVRKRRFVETLKVMRDAGRVPGGAPPPVETPGGGGPGVGGPTSAGQ